MPSPNAASPSNEDTRQELDRILASRTFATSPAHRAFLQRVVLHALTEPDAASLKEAALALDVFGRDAATFDPRLDPVVRIEARRLRERLAKYYGSEGARDPVVIDLPRGGYAAVFSRSVLRVAVEPAAALPVRDRPRRANWWLVAGLLAAVVSAGWFGLARFAGSTAAPVTIAVLPLANLTGDTAQDPFVDALTDEISDGLAHLARTRVAAHASAFSLRHSAFDAPTIGQKLHVAFLVDGSVVRVGDGLRIVIHLTRTSDGYQVWSGSVDTAATLSDAQPTIAQTVIARAAEQLGLPPAAGPPRRTANKDAWDTYVRAVFAREAATLAGFRLAVDLAEQSARTDPNFASAHVEAALTRTYLVGTSDGPASAADMEIVRAHLDAATRLDRDRSGALALRGGIAALYDLDWAAARKFYMRAISVPAVDVAGLSGYAGALALRGQYEDAVAYFERARELDPLNLGLQISVASIAYHAHDFATAIRRFRELDQVGPGNPFVLYGLVVSYAASGDSARARVVLAQLQALAPGWDRLRILPAIVDVASHDRDRALTELRAIDEDFGRRHPFFLGLGFAWAGATDEAVMWLTRAIAAHDMNAAYMLVDPLIDPIRTSPRFREVWNAMPAWSAGIAYPGPYNARPGR